MADILELAARQNDRSYWNGKLSVGIGITMRVWYVARLR
jgi:hypothetical protein